MIISASRRTDIPACYTEWFLNRIREGYAVVRNPMNSRQMRRVSLKPEDVDGIVFWTKNPLPLMERLDELKEYLYYFQFTLTAYNRDIEPCIPDKKDGMIPAFKSLSDKIGSERMVWRYDPILINDRYSVKFHVEAFKEMAEALCGSTDTCVISFLDTYRCMIKKSEKQGIRPPAAEEQRAIVESFADTARKYGFALKTCCEAVDLSAYGVGHSACIDVKRLERISGRKLSVNKDRNQRPGCGCAASVDIGVYSTCRNDCLYCYANRGDGMIMRNAEQYDATSPVLCGRADEIPENDV